MKGLLIRVGIDQTYGKWNAPVDPNTNEFVFFPIPTSASQNLGTTYKKHLDELACFCQKRNFDSSVLNFPLTSESNTHCDPDFDYMTYGDVDSARSAPTKELSSGDFIAFYASLKPITPVEQHKLLYAIVGLFIIDEIVNAGDVTTARLQENAHTRGLEITKTDVIVRAKRGEYGLLKHCIPIGEYRNGAYRVTEALLETWGGLSVNDGWIQRSAVPPRFENPQKFFDWFKQEIR